MCKTLDVYFKFLTLIIFMIHGIQKIGFFPNISTIWIDLIIVTVFHGFISKLYKSQFRNIVHSLVFVSFFYLVLFSSGTCRFFYLFLNAHQYLLQFFPIYFKGFRSVWITANKNFVRSGKIYAHKIRFMLYDINWCFKI